jgi:hypothetical protein
VPKLVESHEKQTGFDLNEIFSSHIENVYAVHKKKVDESVKVQKNYLDILKVLTLQVTVDLL